MLAVSLAGALLFGLADEGFRPMLVFTTLCVAASVGGDVVIGGSAGDAFGQSSLSLIPLGITVVGLSVLALLFARRMSWSKVDSDGSAVWLQVCRTALVFAALLLGIALASRIRSQEILAGISSELVLRGALASTFFGGLVLSATALAVAVVAIHPQILPIKARGFRAAATAPLLGALAVFAVGVVAVLVVACYTLVTQDNRLAQLGVLLLLLPNLALTAVLLPLGAPLTVEGSYSALFRQAGDGQSLSLLSLTDQSAWWWLAGIGAVLIVFAVGYVLMLRQRTLQAARREGFRYALALAALAFVLTILARVSGELSGSATVVGAVAGEVRVLHHPLVAALVAAGWGVVAALVVPSLATVLPAGLADKVRQRVGTVVDHEDDAPPRRGTSAGTETDQ